ncbi:Lrp/AsnC family transcriptional regulator [Leucobacter salsicius]|uniref:Lrp/AsnC family transcriptional regulator n=1 Tax=Leucobacter salsicius TaxID=664638 RepID=UPI00034B1053|nr:Lrp/AsnC family transcriptional regulator [Leucobacter salsicius]
MEHAPRTSSIPSRASASFDEIDAALIHALQINGRATIHELSSVLGISRDSTSARLQRLLNEEGVRVVAAIDPHFAGHHVLTNSTVQVDGPVEPVANRIADIPNAVFVSMTSGPLPLVFESRQHDEDELHRVLDQVRAIPGVRSVNVSRYTEIMTGFFVSSRREPTAIDALDTELIELLQRDGRLSFRTLADSIHLSPTAVRARINKLVDSGAVRISAITSGQLGRSRRAIGLGINARGDSTEIREYLLSASDVNFAARAYGRFDFIATIEGPDTAQLLAVVEGLRALESVSAVDTWAHFNIVKENYERAITHKREP